MRFVILSSARCGNNMLRSALTQHPNISCRDEVLNREYNFTQLVNHWSLTPDELEVCRGRLDNDPIGFFRRYVFASRDPQHHTFGFRLFYDQYAPGNKADLWTWLNAQEDACVIHLQRSNRLRQFLSLRTAMATLDWTLVRPSETPPPTIELSPAGFLKYVARSEAECDAALARLGDLPVIEATYEDLLSDQPDQLRRLQSFLGVEQIEIQPRTVRQGGQRLIERVKNYEELKDELNGTPYAWMLDDHDGEAPAPLPVRVAGARVAGTSPRRSCTRLVAQASMFDLDILPHWVRHYRSLGIEHFHLILHGHGLRLARLRSACRKLGLTVECELHGQFSDDEKRTRQQAIIDRHRGEWLLLVDLDEFLELPYRDFPTTIRALELFGVTALPALMVQRIASDGTLPSISGDVDLGRVFPLGSNLLSELMGSHAILRSKFPLLLATESTSIRLGQHQQPNSDAANYIPISAVLHHYKWRSRLFSDLERRSKNAHISYLESRAYLRWLRDHQDRVPLDSAFACTRQALSDRGLLRRADRSEITWGATLERMRRIRAEGHPAGAATRLRRRLRRMAMPQTSDQSGRGLPMLPAIGRKAHIAIVTFELLVPDRSGGIGTWSANLAMSLRAAGHAVTIFHARTRHTDSAWPVRYWEGHGIELVRLGCDDRRPFVENTLHNLAHVALEALASRRWDIVHLPDALALGWQIAAAKRAGLAFKDTTIVVTLHGNNWWHRTSNRLPMHAHDIELDHLEREQIRGADVVLSPSAYMLEYVGRTYPGLIKSGFVHQNPIAWPFRIRTGEPRNRPVDELVFFGRLEPRKGLWTFCDAVSSLMECGYNRFSVTFLGAFGAAEIRPHLMERIREWPNVKIIESFHVEECRLYLSEPGRLAVMPSSGDNSPYTILECLAGGIPFVATAVGGVPELVLSEDRDKVLVDQGPRALAEALRRCVSEGAVVARPAIPSHQSELRLALWHEHLLATARARSHRPQAEAVAMPSVSICLSPGRMTDRDCSLEWIKTAGLEAEVLLTAGTMSEEVARSIRDLQAVDRFARSSYRELECAGPAPQAHLNCLASNAVNDVLVFADAGMQPNPNSVQMLARAMAHTGAAAISTHVRLMLQKDGRPVPLLPDFQVTSTATPSLARLKNVFGAAVFAVRKDVFARYGGFDERPDFEHSWHWEFLARLVEAGERVDVLPFCFGWWRVDTKLIDQDWPWGAASLLDQIDHGRPTTARHHMQMLHDHLRYAAPVFEQVRRKLMDTSAGGSGGGRGGRHPVLELEGTSLAALRPFKNTRLTQSSDGVEIASSDEDPKVRLPVIESAGSSRDLVVEIRVQVPSEGNLKLYWRNGTNSDTFAEDRSVARYLLPGENNVSLRIPRPSFPVSLRLDPGESPGRYAVHSIVVFGE